MSETTDKADMHEGVVEGYTVEGISKEAFQELVRVQYALFELIAKYGPSNEVLVYARHKAFQLLSDLTRSEYALGVDLATHLALNVVEQT